MEKKMHAGAIKPLYQRAREFRNNATHAETILWGYLKTKPLGYKFRRQHPYSNYILDFYCHAIKLVIEVDGPIHDMPEVKINDGQRQSTLQNDGLFVLRFSNETVEKKSELVVLEIENFLLKKKNEK
jgi:imidazole glycerol-phosphate synthase subunit HisF